MDKFTVMVPVEVDINIEMHPLRWLWQDLKGRGPYPSVTGTYCSYKFRPDKLKLKDIESAAQGKGDGQ